MSKPYTEKFEVQHGTDRKYIIRTFEDSVDTEELVWHRDTTNRKIHILSGSGWQLQMDDSLPTTLEMGKVYFIPRETYHRVIKGEGNLVIRIENI